MMRILWVKNEKKYYDDKETCGGSMTRLVQAVQSKFKSV